MVYFKPNSVKRRERAKITSALGIILSMVLALVRCFDFRSNECSTKQVI